MAMAATRIQRNIMLEKDDGEFADPQLRAKEIKALPDHVHAHDVEEWK